MGYVTYGPSQGVAIKVRDLLTTSSTPGSAMMCADKHWTRWLLASTGIIKVLVTLH